MKIDILHVRDPDDACDTRVFIDGVEQDWEDISIVDIDPGRGYTLDDWRENTQWATEELPEGPLRDAVLAAYGDPPGKQYIQGWGDDEDDWDEVVDDDQDEVEDVTS